MLNLSTALLVACPGSFMNLVRLVTLERLLSDHRIGVPLCPALTSTGSGTVIVGLPSTVPNASS